MWRHDGLLTAAAIADRVRWQLDGWLTGSTGRAGGRPARPTAGIVRLRLVPDGVLAQAGLQPGLWGEAGAERERAHRALSRVQGMLGPEAVVTAVLGGGRSPADQVRLVPVGRRAGCPPAPARRPLPAPSRRRPRGAAASAAAGPAVDVPVGGPDGEPEPPWPGRLPPPCAGRRCCPLRSPADACATPPGSRSWSAPGWRSARAPRPADVGAGRPAEIVGWAGPWPVDERWWAPAEARRRARFQVCLADGRRCCSPVEAGSGWWRRSMTEQRSRELHDLTKCAGRQLEA